MDIAIFTEELLKNNLPVMGVSASPSADFPDCRIDWQEGHPTEAERTLALQLYAAHDPEAYNKLLTNLINTAQSAVGIAINALTAAQRNALMAILLYQAGGIDPKTSTIRPLRDWAR